TGTVGAGVGRAGGATACRVESRLVPSVVVVVPGVSVSVFLFQRAPRAGMVTWSSAPPRVVDQLCSELAGTDDEAPTAAGQPTPAAMSTTAVAASRTMPATPLRLPGMLPPLTTSIGHRLLVQPRPARGVQAGSD
ncbi:MAG TPA: hypothetical protein VEJ21_05345, partial [Acidimicrobiales bacterium]|nr:hypothetical protein [Acidimicrobiales bacterium]